MKHNNNPVFPEGFLWGASSAAWQVEGATLEDGRTQAIIDLNSQTKKPFADNSIASEASPATVSVFPGQESFRQRTARSIRRASNSTTT